MHELLNFRDELLLRKALTHRSYVKENPGETEDNERLEFLGDAILTFLCAAYLYRRYPTMQEDEMTRRRSALVDETQLAQFAIEVGLRSRMRLGKGVIRDSGFQNPNLLSSTFEAVVGAYYLDHDSEINTLRPLIEELFANVPDDVVTSRSAIDAKNRLQEWAQTNPEPALPIYVTEKVGGTDHSPQFVATVLINNQPYGRGEGRSKKEAEKQAAESAIAFLKQQGMLPT
jgi:ribonuclease-3